MLKNAIKLTSEKTRLIVEEQKKGKEQKKCKVQKTCTEQKKSKEQKEKVKS